MNNLPSFIHIGYSKAASTYLQYLLRRSGEIELIYKTNFFRTIESRNKQSDIKKYKEFFKHLDSDKIIIESQEHIILPFIHPDLKVSCTNIAATHSVVKNLKYIVPDAKIILVVRRQYDIIVSRYLQFVLQGGKLSFDKFLKTLVLEGQYINYLDYRYDKVVKALFEAFTPVNVLVLIHEDLKKNRLKFINDLSNFISIDINDYNPPLNQRNTGLSYLGVKLHLILNKLLVSEIETPSHKTITKRLIPYKFWKFASSVTRYLDDKFVSNKNKQKLTSQENINYINSVFRKSNIELANMIHRNLTQYNYY